MVEPLDPYELINPEPTKSEYRFIILGALGALSWVVIFLIAKWIGA